MTVSVRGRAGGKGSSNVAWAGVCSEQGRQAVKEDVVDLSLMEQPKAGDLSA